MRDAVIVMAAEAARFLLAIAITLQNSAILYWVLTHAVPEVSKELTIMIVNGSGTLQGIALTYYFGSSAGSAQKDRAMANLTAKVP